MSDDIQKMVGFEPKDLTVLNDIIRKLKSDVETASTSSGAGSAVTRGFEIGDTANDDATVIVNAGSLYHGTTAINKTENTTLTFATASDWYDSSVHSYSGGAGWNYIGVNADGGIKFCHTNAPDTADVSGNTDGTHYYYNATGTYWRIIGAVYVDTDDQVHVDYYTHQEGNYISFLEDTTITLGSATSWTNVSCAAVVPGICRIAYFTLYVSDDAVSWSIGGAIRPGDGGNNTYGGVYVFLNVSGASGNAAVANSGICGLDSSQTIDYNVNEADDVAQCRIPGYWINVR